MVRADDIEPHTGERRSLRIHFTRGERPYVFWVSEWSRQAAPHCRYKILSKRRADAALEVLVVEEREDGGRRALAEEIVPADHPSGWLERWAEDFGASVGVRLQSFDLRHVETRDEWSALAETLGWSHARSAAQRDGS